MFYSIIDAASLKKPTILNSFHQLKVKVEFEPESSVGKYHFIFIVEIKVEEILQVITQIQKEMNDGWYAFFWDNTVLYIVFNRKYFQIDVHHGWNSKDYVSAQEFGRGQKIPEEYLNFKKYFQPNKALVDNL